MSQRLDGVLLDQSRDVPRDFPLQQIKAPTLVIHARDDSLVDYSNGQHTAGKIIGAEFMTLKDGGISCWGIMMRSESGSWHS